MGGVERLSRLRTRVNQLLELGIPSLFAGNLFLDSRDLFQMQSVWCGRGGRGAEEKVAATYQVSRLNLEAELLLLEIL